MDKIIKILKIMILITLIITLLIGCAKQEKFTTNNEQTPTNSNNEPAIQSFNVEISGFSFNPQTTNIKEGDSVTWTNMDSAPHTIDFESFISETLNKGGQYTHRFNTKGVYQYKCSIHPSMVGKIIVE